LERHTQTEPAEITLGQYSIGGGKITVDITHEWIYLGERRTTGGVLWVLSLIFIINISLVINLRYVTVSGRTLHIENSQ